MSLTKPVAKFVLVGHSPLISRPRTECAFPSCILCPEKTCNTSYLSNLRRPEPLPMMMPAIFVPGFPFLTCFHTVNDLSCSKPYFLNRTRLDFLSNRLPAYSATILPTAPSRHRGPFDRKFSLSRHHTYQRGDGLTVCLIPNLSSNYYFRSIDFKVDY